MPNTRFALFAAAFITVALLAAGEARAWVDDYDITVTSAKKVASTRGQLRTFVWGKDGFPTASSELISSNMDSPVAGLTNLERVEKLRTTMTSAGGPIIVTSFHFIPAQKKNRLVVLHAGHGCPVSFDDVAKGSGALQRTIKALLQDGYGVMAIFMPFNSDEQCEKDKHASLFAQDSADGSGMHFFLDPTAESLNYAAKAYSYHDFNMIGISGGGWATTVYAAIDPRIKVSIPVAGSVPLYMRKTPYQHDEEQFHDAFYAIAGLPDLYILGSYGKGRQQIQVLNLNDPCCFGATLHDTSLPHVADKPAAQQAFEPSVRLYEERVQKQMHALGKGSFRVVVDPGNKHTITDHVIETVILPALNSR